MQIPIMAGTGGISPAHVIAHTQQAADAGADSCLIVTPYYVKPTQVCKCTFEHWITHCYTVLRSAITGMFAMRM
jgi:dihydrodipicolinate synthase/N-acetylneuraminate lyase